MTDRDNAELLKQIELVREDDAFSLCSKELIEADAEILDLLAQ